MKIGLINGSDFYWLAGSTTLSEREHSSAAGFELTAESAVQMLNLVRAEYARPVDRGNVLNRITFSTTRQFSTPSAAFLYALDYDGTVPRTGTLHLQAGSSDVRYMANAVVSPPLRRVVGATLFLDYTVVGGAISTDP